MTTVDIEPLELGDAETVRAWADMRAEAHAADFPHLPPMRQESEIGGLGVPWPGGEPHHFLARRDGEVVGYLRFGLSRQSNLDTAGFYAVVHPKHRRAGVGRALYEFAAAKARENGRTRMIADAPVGIDGHERDESGARFLESLGFAGFYHQISRALDVSTVDEGREEELYAEALAKAGDDYEVVRFGEPAPEEFVGDMAVLNARLSADISQYLDDWEPSLYDAEKIRAYERAAAARLWRRLHVAVRHRPSGRLVAWSFLTLVSEHGERAVQGVTVVDPAHRGRRLGTVVKIALNRYARETDPRLREIETWNDDENAHMIAINELLGFRPSGVEAGYRKEL